MRIEMISSAAWSRLIRMFLHILTVFETWLSNFIYFYFLNCILNWPLTIRHAYICICIIYTFFTLHAIPNSFATFVLHVIQRMLSQRIQSTVKSNRSQIEYPIIGILIPASSVSDSRCVTDINSHGTGMVICVHCLVPKRLQTINKYYEQRMINTALRTTLL